MNRLLTAILVLCTAPHAVLASWAGMDPSYVASTCPVVVSGEIVAIAEASAKVGDRLLDVAHIKVTAVHKNLLDDVDPKPNDILEARMHSRKDPIRMSNELSYPVGTKAMWMLYLGEDGAFYINRCPEQCQRDEKAAKEIRLDREARMVVKGRQRPYTRQEWIALQKEGKRRAAEAEAERERKRQAIENAVREAISGLYDDNVLQADSLPSLLKFPDEIRSELVNRSERDLNISRDDWITLHCYLVKKDPIENHRVRALPGKIGGSERCRKLLLESLKDPSPRVRLFACQALFLSEEKDAEMVAAVANLLNDDMRDVQMTAVRALGRLGDKSHVQPILALYHKQEVTEGDAWVFAQTLARLGETEVPLKCFRKAMTSENWNIRRFAIKSLEFLEARRAVPAAIAALPAELRQAINDRRRYHLADDQDLAVNMLVGVLAKRTGQGHGKDVLAWLTWWQKVGKEYGVADTRFDADEARKLQAEYQELFGKPPLERRD